MNTLETYCFKGHEGFALQEGWLSRGLRELHKDPGLFFQYYGTGPLGVGLKMAKSIRFWLKCCGMTTDRREGVFLSELGQIILEQDPGLQDIFSRWVIHSNIVRNTSQATAWDLFFNRFSGDGFTLLELRQWMQGEAEKLPDLSRPEKALVECDCSVLLELYARRHSRLGQSEQRNTSFLSGLDLLHTDRSRYWKGHPDVSGIPSEVIWYLISDRKQDFTLEELATQDGLPGKIMNLESQDLLELLIPLADRQIIQQKNAADHIMICRKEDSEPLDVVRNYYSGRQQPVMKG